MLETLSTEELVAMQRQAIFAGETKTSPNRVAIRTELDRRSREQILSNNSLSHDPITGRRNRV